MTQVLGGERIALDGAPIVTLLTTAQGEGPKKCYSEVCDSFPSIYESFNTLAAQLASEEGTQPHLDKLKACLLQLVASQASNRARLEAIAQFASQYQCSTEKTDFQEELQTLVAARLRSPGTKTDPAYGGSAVAEMERAIEKAQRSRERVDDEDEDLVVTQAGGGAGSSGAGGYSPPNSKCPISGKSLDDVTDPVEDEKGYVYEKESITQYIKQQTRGRSGANAVTPCPQSGTSHVISLQTLAPASRFLRARKIRKLARERNRNRDEDEDGDGDGDGDVIETSP